LSFKKIKNSPEPIQTGTHPNLSPNHEPGKLEKFLRKKTAAEPSSI